MGIMEAALNEAIAVAGSQNKLAKGIGVSQALVWYWVHKRGGRVSAEKALDIERMTGVSRPRLRPDLFG